jgi:hypothetical protein
VHITAIEWVWIHNECAWPSLSHYWMHLTVVWPREDRICVETEHPLNICECTWMPMSEYWAPPEHALSAHECLWLSISKVMMHTSRVVNSTIYRDGSNWEFRKLALIYDIEVEGIYQINRVSWDTKSYFILKKLW